MATKKNVIKSDYVFTAASTLNKKKELDESSYYGHQLPRYVSRGNPCCLIFGNRRELIDLNDLTLHKEIAEDEFTHKFLGNTFIILPYYRETQPTVNEKVNSMLIATSEVTTECREMLPIIKGLPVTIVKEGTITYTNGYNFIGRCKNPEQQIVGCTYCSETDIRYPCELIKLNNLKGNTSYDIDDYRDMVTYWKTHIGRFAAIGPSHTHNKVGIEANRPINRHYFKEVNTKLSYTEAAIYEKQRKLTLMNEFCSKCTVKQDACWLYGEFPGWCRGYYPESYKTLAEEIMYRINSKFTNKELVTLLLNCGELSTRVNRCISYATMTMHNNHFYFRIAPRNRPNTEAFHMSNSYKESMELLKKYRETIIEPKDLFKMSTEQKATLVELISHRQSPTYRAGWVRTSYERLCTRLTQEGKLISTFKYGGRSGQELPWELEAKNLQDIYKYYGTFTYASRTTIPREWAYRQYSCS